MTDTATTTAEAAPEAGQPVEMIDEATVRTATGELLRLCAMPGCQETFTIKYPSENRRNCDTHKGQRVDGRPSGAHGRGGGDRPPSSVRVDLNLGKPAKTKDPALEAVEKRLSSIAGMMAVVVLLVGQPEDAADIERARAQWAAAGAELAAYEPWLKKLAAGGEASERVLAWVKFATATGAMLVPILLRHDVLPAPLANLLGAMASSPEADAMGRVFEAMAQAGGGTGDPGAGVAA